MQLREPDFDRLFDAIVADPAGSSAEAPPPAEPAAAAAARSDEAREEKIRVALALFHRGEYRRCVALLGEVESDGGHDPRVVAFLAASRALVHGQVRSGLQVCVETLRKAFYIPDLYCALGVLLLRGGDRSKAYAAFHRGLRIDPKHPALRARVREMGVRRSPLLRFLPRTHPANRVLGILRARLFPA